jgi:hypothetical protein
MLLHQIIEANTYQQTSILWEKISPYKKALYTYYKNYFCGEPVLMVTDVFNAAQYVKIVPADELTEAIEEYLINEDGSEEDKEAYRETISFNSVMLKDLI